MDINYDEHTLININKNKIATSCLFLLKKTITLAVRDFCIDIAV